MREFVKQYLVLLCVSFEFRRVKPGEQEKYLKRVGGNLRRIRQDKSLTMEQLAHEADIEYRQLGCIVRGEINTSILSLLRICQALHVEIDEMFH